jgi:hypothetical protein
MAAESFLHLVCKYCNHRLPARQAEYDFCVRRNLNNPYLKKLHNLLDPSIVVPEDIRNHPKYAQATFAGSWLSYKDAFAYANKNLAGEIVCISNLDIFLDDAGTKWEDVIGFANASIVLSLARTEYDGAGGSYKDPLLASQAFYNSQDAWIFLAPFEVPDCDFDIGTLGCDNAIAERIRRTGRIPVNSPNRFKILHFDRARGKTHANQREAHAAQRQGKSDKYPEEQGYLFLPDIDQIKSMDELLNVLQVSELERYVLICQTLSKFRKPDNRLP